MMDDYMRDLLKDNTCEPPAFEHEMPRYDHGAKNLLNVMHHGARSEVKPDHPEIYIANTAPDPRGCQTMPNMRLHKEEMEKRMKYKDLVSTATSDQGVTEGVWSDHSINQAMRSTWAGLKARMQWFDRSVSARHPGVALKPTTRGSILDYIESDEDKNHTLSEIHTPLFTPGEVVLGRGHKKVIIGPRNVPTHVFGVARFGAAPKSFNYKYDATKNKMKAVQTQQFQKSEAANLRSIAKIMATEAGCQRPDMQTSGRDFTKSAEGMADRRVGKHGDARKTLDQMVHTQQIAEQVIAIAENKRAREQSSGDIANQRLHKLIDEDMYAESADGKHVAVKLIDDPFSRAARRYNQLTELDEDDSVSVPLYSMVKPQTIDQIRAARDHALVEHEAEESATVFRGKTNLRENQQHDVVRDAKEKDETIFLDSNIKDRIIGPIGDKSRIRNHLRFEPRNGDLADINSQFAKTSTKAVGPMVSRNVTMDESEADTSPIARDYVSPRR
jgi:hypothetical protein